MPSSFLEMGWFVACSLWRVFVSDKNQLELSTGHSVMVSLDSSLTRAHAQILLVSQAQHNTHRTKQRPPIWLLVCGMLDHKSTWQSPRAAIESYPTQSVCIVAYSVSSTTG